MESFLFKSQLFVSQNLDLEKEQLDEMEQKAQAKNTKRTTEWGEKSLRNDLRNEKLEWMSKQ